MLDISRFPIRPKKVLDQYFLVDEGFIEEEVSALDLNSGDSVLEVGSGLGFLTRALARKARIIAVEKDKVLCRILAQELSGLPVEVICEDALKLELSSLDFNKFASNLPYSISRKLVLKLLRTNFDLGVIICQEEFARKLVARPGDENYRAISVIAQFYAEISLGSLVPRNAFQPMPPVESRIVVFRKRNPVNQEFESFVKRAFSQRRKALFAGKRPEKLGWNEFWEAFRGSREVF